MTNATQQRAAAHTRLQSTNSGNTITKAQWEQITEELQGYFCLVRFQYQNTVISISRVRYGESRTFLAVYFDGKMAVDWGREDSEAYNPVTRLFWCEKKKRYYSAKRVAEIEKSLGKRSARKHFPKLHESLSYRIPLFTNSTSLVRQFKKVDGLVWLCEKEANSEA